MTHFEYIFVAVSIILSFAFLRLLDALPSVFSAAKGYWVHAVWVVFLLYMCASFWWLSWFNRNLDLMSFRYFLFLLFAPSALFLTATSLVSISPTSVSTWREHFTRYRRRFFVGAFIYVAALVTNSFVTFGVSVHHPMRIGQAFILVILGAGTVVKTDRAHAVLAGLIAAMLALLFVGVLMGRVQMSFE